MLFSPAARRPAWPDIRPLGEDTFLLLKDYVYDWIHEGSRYRICVPRGFIFDMASVPRIVWPLISPFGLGPAAVPHDWLYNKRGRLNDGSFQHFVETTDGGFWEPLTGAPYRWTRKNTDRLFGRMMRESKVTTWKRRAAYLAVRAFGIIAWWT